MTYEMLAKELDKDGGAERRVYNRIQIDLAKRYAEKIGKADRESRNEVMEDWIEKYSTKFREILDANILANKENPDKDITSIYMVADEEEKEKILLDIEALLYKE